MTGACDKPYHKHTTHTWQVLVTHSITNIQPTPDRCLWHTLSQTYNPHLTGAGDTLYHKHTTHTWQVLVTHSITKIQPTPDRYWWHTLSQTYHPHLTGAGDTLYHKHTTHTWQVLVTHSITNIPPTPDRCWWHTLSQTYHPHLTGGYWPASDRIVISEHINDMSYFISLWSHEYLLLDYILISDHLMNEFHSCLINAGFHSDHSRGIHVILALNNSQFTRGKGL